MPASIRPSVRRRIAVLLAAAGLALTANAAVASSSSASAQVSCSGWSWGNFDSGSGHSTGTYHLKSGPYSSCSDVGQTYAGTFLYYHCYVQNDYGNTWSHVRISGTQIQGWISDANLTYNDNEYHNQGAVEEC